MKKALFVLTIAVFCIIGCLSEPCIMEPLETDSQFAEPGEWYEIVNTDTLSNTFLTETYIGNKLHLGYDMVRISFLYLSGPDSIQLSGCVCWPLKADTCSEIWLENHHFTVRWDQCPTQSVMPGMLQASLRRAVYISADYQGLGLSKGMNQPYLNTPLIARQCIDCLKAAKKVLKDMGLILDKDFHTYNIGYSLGGAVSLGIAKEIESDTRLQDIVHLKKSFCGGGPYDQIALFHKYLSEPDEPLEYPIEFLCGIYTILQSNKLFAEVFDEQDLLSDNLYHSGIIQLLETKEYTAPQLCRIMQEKGFATLSSIISPDMIDTGSTMHKAFLRELEQFDLTTGWSPRIPVLFYHSRSDMTVPSECLESVITHMPDNPCIEFMFVDSSDHYQTGNLFYTNLVYGLFKLD